MKGPDSTDDQSVNVDLNRKKALTLENLDKYRKIFII